MQIKYVNNLLIIHIHRNINKNNIRDELTTILESLKDKQILTSGCYDAKVYCSNNKETIIEIVKDRTDLRNYFLDDIEVEINFLDNCVFLYEIDDPFHIKLKNYKLYYYKEKNYILYTPEKNSIQDMMFLGEYTNIIYGEEVNDVLLKGLDITNHFIKSYQ